MPSRPFKSYLGVDWAGYLLPRGGHPQQGDAHLLVLEDSTLLEEVKRFVETEKVNVAYAFHEIAEKYAHALGSVEDEYLREPAADIRDVTSRVLGHLSGHRSQDLSHLTEPYIS